MTAVWLLSSCLASQLFYKPQTNVVNKTSTIASCSSKNKVTNHKVKSDFGLSLPSIPVCPLNNKEIIFYNLEKCYSILNVTKKKLL